MESRFLNIECDTSLRFQIGYHSEIEIMFHTYCISSKNLCIFFVSSVSSPLFRWKKKLRVKYSFMSIVLFDVHNILTFNFQILIFFAHESTLKPCIISLSNFAAVILHNFLFYSRKKDAKRKKSFVHSS